MVHKLHQKEKSTIEQCMHALFECLEYANEITKKNTKAVSGEFCKILLFLQKIILGVT